MDSDTLADVFKLTMPVVELVARGSGIVLISTLVFWNVPIDWATFRFPAVDKLFAARRLCLVRNGRPNRRNMRREYISDKELLSKVREEGLEDLSRVKLMYLESDGEISLIRMPGDDDAKKAPHPAGR